MAVYLGNHLHGTLRVLCWESRLVRVRAGGSGRLGYPAPTLEALMSSTRETWAAMLVIGLLLALAMFGPYLFEARVTATADELSLGIGASFQR